MTPICAHVNGRTGSGAGRAAHPSRRFPARALPPHRNASRLRARRVRRLHGIDRRRAARVMHHLRGRMRRRGRANDRRLRRRRCHARTARRPFRGSTRCNAASARPACLIAARDIVRAAAGRGRAPHPGRAFRQSLSVHGLSRHRQRSGKRDRGTGVENRRCLFRRSRAASNALSMLSCRPTKPQRPRLPHPSPRPKRHARAGRGSRRASSCRDRRRRCGRCSRTFPPSSPA